MDPREIATAYYDAWRTRAGDMTGVPFAGNFTFRGPVASFDSAEGYRAMARQAGAAVRDFRVRHQFVDGDLVCSIIDWQMAPLPGTLTAAEILHIRNGTIVAGELIYDAEDLRKAMTAAAPTGDGPDPADVVGLLERSYHDTAAVLSAITPAGFAAPSPCTGWTVRQVGNHLVASILLLARVAEGDTVTPADFDAQAMADTDHLGGDPAAAFHTAAQRSTAVFKLPDTLARSHRFPPGPTPGIVLANISLLESLVHGWDLAHGAGVQQPADPDVVAAVHHFAAQAIGEPQRQTGLFAAPCPVDADAEPFTRLLAHLGRRT
jgi:uncharacterized protein (TIGR03086 family)